MAKNRRRQMLQQGGAAALWWAGAGMVTAARAANVPAEQRRAFDAKTLQAALQALGLAAPVESSEVTISGPDVAENGAVVPFTIAATAPDVRQLLLLVDKNPSTLAAAFALTPGVEAQLATRVKMGESSNVYAVAVTGDGRVLLARKDVRVVLGGCGG